MSYGRTRRGSNDNEHPPAPTYRGGGGGRPYWQTSSRYTQQQSAHDAEDYNNDSNGSYRPQGHHQHHHASYRGRGGGSRGDWPPVSQHHHHQHDPQGGSAQRAYFTYGNQNNNNNNNGRTASTLDSEEYRYGAVHRGGASSYVPRNQPNGANQQYRLHGGTPPDTSPSKYGPSTPTTTPPLHPQAPPTTTTPNSGAGAQRIVKVETIDNVVHTYRSNIPYRRTTAESPPQPLQTGGGGEPLHHPYHNSATPHHSNGSSPNLGPTADPMNRSGGGGGAFYQQQQQQYHPHAHSPSSSHSYYGGPPSSHHSQPNICRHFLNGNCNRATMCRFVHPEKHHVVVRSSRTPNSFHPLPAPLNSPAGMTTNEEEDVDDLTLNEEFLLPPSTASFPSNQSLNSHQRLSSNPNSPQRHDPYAGGHIVLAAAANVFLDETAQGKGSGEEEETVEEEGKKMALETDRLTSVSPSLSQAYQRTSTDVYLDEDEVSAAANGEGQHSMEDGDASHPLAHHHVSQHHHHEPYQWKALPTTAKDEPQDGLEDTHHEKEGDGENGMNGKAREGGTTEEHPEDDTVKVDPPLW